MAEPPIGDPDSVSRKFELAMKIGTDEMFFLLGDGLLPRDVVLRSFELFATKVTPRFAEREVLMQWLIPVAMGLWAIWTWVEEQEHVRRGERARLAALYVNPFLSACEDLQSRIYHILELDGLRVLRSRYPDGAYAEETLYLIVRYFGWTAAIRRYSPYAQEPIVTKLIEKISSAFATSNAELPVGPFNFFHTEQKALGKMIMHRDEGQHGTELDTISYYAFKDSLASPPLSESVSVQQSLHALRETQNGEHLSGRERLVTAQRHLVEVLHYIEGKEGYSFFLGERKKCSVR